MRPPKLSCVEAAHSRPFWSDGAERKEKRPGVAIAIHLSTYSNQFIKLNRRFFYIQPMVVARLLVLPSNTVLQALGMLEAHMAAPVDLKLPGEDILDGGAHLAIWRHRIEVGLGSFAARAESRRHQISEFSRLRGKFRVKRAVAFRSAFKPTIKQRRVGEARKLRLGSSKAAPPNSQ